MDTKLRISEIEEKIKHIVKKTFMDLKYYNIRIIKIAYREISKSFLQVLNDQLSEQINTNTVAKQLFIYFIQNINKEIELVIRLGRLYYENYTLYTELFNATNSKINFPFIIDTENVTKKGDKKTKNLELEKKLTPYSIDLSDLTKNVIRPPKNNVIDNMVKTISFFNFLYKNYLCLYFHKNIIAKSKLLIIIYQSYLKNKNYDIIKDLLNEPRYRNIILNDLEIADKSYPHDIKTEQINKLFYATEFNLFNEEEHTLILNHKNDLITSNLLDSRLLTHNLQFLNPNTIELGTIFIKLGKEDMVKRIIDLRLKVYGDVPLSYYDLEDLEGSFIWFYEKGLSIIEMLQNMQKYSNTFLSNLFNIVSDQCKEPELKIEKKLQLLLTISTLIISDEMKKIQLVKINNIDIKSEVDKFLESNNKFSNNSFLQGLMYHYIYLLRKSTVYPKKIPLSTMKVIKNHFGHDLPYYIGIKEEDQWFWEQYTINS